MKRIIRYCRKQLCSISPITANKIMYKKQMGRPLNIQNPQTFNEKINWLKLYHYPNDKLVIDCTDKLLVREYVKSKGLGEILNELYYSYDCASDIKWDELPNSFVLKCTHGCAYNIICDDKNNLNIGEAIKKLDKWIKEDFGKVSAEPHYSQISPKIICEKHLGNNILDYKFFCFKGVPKFLYISRAVNGSHHGMKAEFFNLDGSKAPFRRMDHSTFEESPKMITHIEEAEKICCKLSEDFEFVRVDLFEVNNKIYFSELTFSPCAGMMPISPQEYDRKLGDLIELKGRLK